MLAGSPWFTRSATIPLAGFRISDILRVKSEDAKMASVKKGQLAKPAEWWKHLRWMKRKFWKRERIAGKVDIEARKQEAAGT